MKSSDIDRFFDAFAFDFTLLNGCGVGRGAPATTTAGSSSAHHQNLSATYQRYMVDTWRHDGDVVGTANRMAMEGPLRGGHQLGGHCGREGRRRAPHGRKRGRGVVRQR
ncbi:hypothetical protein GUJ93_ZPchr0278g22892 [Zizania palustris]|uniref:Uncharacterized protein n=1 Tax=Zizania palustris TaxID=103762 RepID=A0A8J5RKC6_ZIZPA|nr:hypothetical protein GUJ93_ZPchr0278g22892 [Zizania palustris]